MHYFHYIENKLWCEEVPLATIAEEVGTPCYIYSHRTLERHFKAFSEPLAGIPHLICYSMKANSNLSILKLFLNRGSGVDIVSGGELYRALKAGVPADRIVFSGVGKTNREIAEALHAGIRMFNVESEAELEAIQAVASGLDKQAPISLRVNPDIDPKTHPYISTGLKKSKFGVDILDAERIFARAAQMSHIEVVGVDCHIGSQITELDPFVAALKKLKVLVNRLRQEHGLPIRYLDLGGGLGIAYQGETPPAPAEYAARILAETQDLNCTLIFEPGRVLVGNAGILLTRVTYLKKNQDKQFVIVDSGMNHLIRPSLYGSYQAIQPVFQRTSETFTADVVGPICESGDFFAQDREIAVVERGDLLAIMSSGAYGYTMASFYNSYARPAEVMVKGSEYAVIRQPDTREMLTAGEELPAFAL
jgi:diaminopimelate decarboxylase